MHPLEFKDITKDQMENIVDNARRETNKYKGMVKSLYGIVVRAMVILKQLFRVASVVGCYYCLGRNPTLALVGFIAVLAALQLSIDKARAAVNPKLRLSEWDIDFLD